MNRRFVFALLLFFARDLFGVDENGKKRVILPFRLKTDHGVFTEFIRGQAY